MTKKRQSKAEVLLAIIVLVYLAISFYYGSLDPRQWILRFNHVVVTNIGRIVQSVGGGGTQELIGIFWESSCVNEVSAIDWGTLSPGESTNRTIYIKNTASRDVSLAFSTQNWNPASAGQYIALTTSYVNQTLSSQQVLEVTLTLTVSPTITGVTEFSFDIVVEANEVA